MAPTTANLIAALNKMLKNIPLNPFWKKSRNNLDIQQDARTIGQLSDRLGKYEFDVVTDMTSSTQSLLPEK